MSMVVYQGVESRLDSSESKTLKLKLVTPNILFSKSLESTLKSCNVPEAYSMKLVNCITSETLRAKVDEIYVHPSVKRASWWLSDESLNLCTENLGSETGSEFVENSIFSSESSESSKSTDHNISEIRAKREERKPRNRRVLEAKMQLPPPLTTLCGLESFDIKPQRENGRLILKAIRTIRPMRSCFLVDRSNGRLRLSLADSRLSVGSSKVNVTDFKEGEYENENLVKNIPADENTTCSDERVEMTKKKYLLDQQVTRGTSSFCRCNENHKNHTNKINTKTKGLMSSMVKLEPRFLVASS